MTPPQTSLLVIDDASLRNAHFAAAAKVLKKIERLEAAVQSFHGLDKDVYARWLEDNFQPHQAQLAEKNELYFKLKLVERCLRVLSALEDISIPEAYARVKEEMERHRAGFPDDKQKIEAVWRERERALDEKTRPKFHFREEPEEDPGPRDEEEDQDNFEEEEYKNSRKKRKEDLLNFWQKSGKKLAEDDDSIEWLWDAVIELEDPEVFEIFLEIWESASIPFQQKFRRVFRNRTGSDLEETLAYFRQSRAHEHAEHSEESAADPEEVKRCYRRLALLLHPDRSALADSFSFWRKELWLRAQSAYENQDLTKLQQIHRIVLLLQKQLNDLSLEEIRSGYLLLEHELKILEANAKSMKKMPHWRFSQKKSKNSITRKIERDFEQSLDSLDFEIERLQDYFEFLDSSPRRRSGGGRSRI